MSNKAEDEAQAFREIAEREEPGFAVKDKLGLGKDASADASLEPCEESRDGDGFGFDDDNQWHVDSVHSDPADPDTRGFIGLWLHNQDTGETHGFTLLPEAAMLLAQDIIAVATHVGDVDRREQEQRYAEVEQRAADTGFFYKLVDRALDDQGEPYYKLDGTRHIYPKKWVPCDRNDEGAVPDVQAYLRSEAEE